MGTLTLLVSLVACSPDPACEAADCPDPNDSWDSADFPVVINEVMASNATGLQDASGAYPDWVELANIGDVDVDMSLLSLTDDPTQPQRYAFPEGTFLPAGAYLVVFADADPPTDGELHTPFRLEMLGESLHLYGPASADLPLLDEVEWGPQTTDVSLARLPDGTGPFAEDPTPTPGAPND